MQNAPHNQEQNPQGPSVNNTPPQNKGGWQPNYNNSPQNGYDAGHIPPNNGGYPPPTENGQYQNQQPQYTPPPFFYYPPPYPYMQNGYQNPPVPPQPAPPPDGQNIPNQPQYIPYGQPVYYVPVQMYPPQMFQSEEMVRKGFEKKAVKRTANHIGLGLIMFFIVSILVSFMISPILKYSWGKKLFVDPAFTLALNMIITLIGFLLATIFIFKSEKAKPQLLLSYGPPKKGLLLPAIMTGLGFCYVANIVTSLFQNALSNFLPFPENDVVLPEGVFGFILSLLSVAVFPAILEEFLFRGAIMGTLLKFGKPFAIFTSAALFGLIHGNFTQIPFAFMVGLVIGFLVIETESIWTGVIIHFLNNSISVCFDYMGAYLGEDLRIAVYMILLVTIILVGIFGIYILSVKNKDLFKYKKVPHISTAKEKLGWFCSSAAVIVFLCIVAFELDIFWLALGFSI